MTTLGTTCLDRTPPLCTRYQWRKTAAMIMRRMHCRRATLHPPTPLVAVVGMGEAAQNCVQVEAAAAAAVPVAVAAPRRRRRTPPPPAGTRLRNLPPTLNTLAAFLEPVVGESPAPTGLATAAAVQVKWRAKTSRYTTVLMMMKRCERRAMGLVGICCSIEAQRAEEPF